MQFKKAQQDIYRDWATVWGRVLLMSTPLRALSPWLPKTSLPRQSKMWNLRVSPPPESISRLLHMHKSERGGLINCTLSVTFFIFFKRIINVHHYLICFLFRILFFVATSCGSLSRTHMVSLIWKILKTQKQGRCMIEKPTPFKSYMIVVCSICRTQSIVCKRFEWTLNSQAYVSSISTWKGKCPSAWVGKPLAPVHAVLEFPHHHRPIPSPPHRLNL